MESCKIKSGFGLVLLSVVCGLLVWSHSSLEAERTSMGPAPQPTDLNWHVSRAMDNIARWTRPMMALDPGPAVHGGSEVRGWADFTHNVGRALDGLFKGESATGREAPAPVVQKLRSFLFATLDNEAGFPAAYGREKKRMTLSSHDLRESVQALLELGMRRQDREALDRLGRLLDILLDITDQEGAYRPEVVSTIPLLRLDGPPGLLSAFTDEGDPIYSPGNGAFYHPQATTVDRGRLIMALCQVYERLGDSKALELARRFVRRVRTHSFSQDGRLQQDAGCHTHSITGTVHGLAYYGWLTKDLDTLEHARRILDVGLAPTRSSFGWSVENAWRERVVGRGEVNNTGDMIQAALFMGLAGYPQYFQMAERMIRSHILPSQWLEGQEFHAPPNAPDNALKEFPSHADGGWGCPGVSDRHVPGAGSSILDIIQGGIQCLWAAQRNVVSQDSWEVRVNLAFSHDTEAASVVSRVPLEGRVTVTLKKKASLWFRKPTWLPWEQLSIRVGKEPVRLRRVGAWAVTPRQESGTVLEAVYPLVRRNVEEWVQHKRYRFVYEGDTIVAMSPRGLYAPMYGEMEE